MEQVTGMLQELKDKFVTMEKTQTEMQGYVKNLMEGKGMGWNIEDYKEQLRSNNEKNREIIADVEKRHGEVQEVLKKLEEDLKEKTKYKEKPKPEINLSDRKGFSDLQKWSGSRTAVLDYETWRYEMMIFLNDADPMFGKILEWIDDMKGMEQNGREKPKELDEQDCNDFVLKYVGKGDGDDELQGDLEEGPVELGTDIDEAFKRFKWLNNQFYSVMARKTTGAAQTIVRGLEDADKGMRGLLAWQRVHRDAMGWNSTRRRALNNAVNHPSRIDKLADVPSRMDQWDIDRRQLQRLENVQLGDLREMDIIQSMMPTTLQNLLISNAHTLTTPKDMRQYIDNHCFQARPDEKSGKASEANNLDEEHNMENNEDQALNEMGKGGGKFDGHCNWCGGYGHKKQDCRKMDAYLQNKDKGQGKGDQGGKGGKDGKGYKGQGKGYPYQSYQPWGGGKGKGKFGGGHKGGGIHIQFGAPQGKAGYGGGNGGYGKGAYSLEDGYHHGGYGTDIPMFNLETKSTKNCFEHPNQFELLKNTEMDEDFDLDIPNVNELQIFPRINKEPNIRRKRMPKAKTKFVKFHEEEEHVECGCKPMFETDKELLFHLAQKAKVVDK